MLTNTTRPSQPDCHLNQAASPRPASELDRIVRSLKSWNPGRRERALLPAHELLPDYPSASLIAPVMAERVTSRFASAEGRESATEWLRLFWRKHKDKVELASDSHLKRTVATLVAGISCPGNSMGALIIRYFSACASQGSVVPELRKTLISRLSLENDRDCLTQVATNLIPVTEAAEAEHIIALLKAKSRPEYKEYLALALRRSPLACVRDFASDLVEHPWILMNDCVNILRCDWDAKKLLGSLPERLTL